MSFTPFRFLRPELRRRGSTVEEGGEKGQLTLRDRKFVRRKGRRGKRGKSKRNRATNSGKAQNRGAREPAKKVEKEKGSNTFTGYTMPDFCLCVFGLIIDLCPGCFQLCQKLFSARGMVGTARGDRLQITTSPWKKRMEGEREGPRGEKRKQAAGESFFGLCGRGRGRKGGKVPAPAAWEHAERPPNDDGDLRRRRRRGYQIPWLLLVAPVLPLPGIAAPSVTTPPFSPLSLLAPSPFSRIFIPPLFCAPSCPSQGGRSP